MSQTPTEPTRVDFPSPGGIRVAAYRWDPAGDVRGIVQLTHGMGEHSRRYTELARALNAHGYVVYAQDHRGHGATATTAGELGRLGPGGWAELVGDIDRLRQRARQDHPSEPLVLLGHSMGSFAVQQYLLDHSADVDAVVLTGTAAIDILEPALDLDGPMDLSAFNAAFEPARTDYDWLSRDDAQVDRYVADPLCGFGLDSPGSKEMFEGARRLASPDRLRDVRHDLPVYIAVGAQDPVNGQLALLDALVDRLRAAGLEHVTVKVYPGARHEVFNETNRDEVVEDLLGWIDSSARSSTDELVVDTVVLDVDGTLVDTVYQHTMAWATAFGEVGVDVPLWKLHRAVGMGGDRYVAEVAGEDVEKRYGDRLRDRHDELFGAEIDRVRPLPGAPELLRELRDQGLKVVLASSGVAEHTERLLKLVGADETAQGATSSSDVEQSKPAPDLIEAAIEKVDGERAVVVGDAVWDIAAAVRARVHSIGLLSGGFGDGELREAGADAVYADAQDLLDHLDQTPMRRRRRTGPGQRVASS